MGVFRRFVVGACIAVSAGAGGAYAGDDPIGASGRASFSQLELAGLKPSLISAHAAAPQAALLNGPANATLLERTPARDAFAFSVAYAFTPWLSLDFAHGMVRVDGDDNPAYLATRIFDQAGATLHRRGWNASLFVNYFRMDTTTQDDGVQASNASFVNARVNHDLSRRVRLSFDVLNVFDKRVGGIDRLASPRLWTEPLVSENVLFDASESRGFRLRLRATF
jgi:hypothetical protein